MDWMQSARIPVSWPRSLVPDTVSDRADLPASELEHLAAERSVHSVDEAASPPVGTERHSFRSREGTTVWRCLRCDSDRFSWHEGQWTCSDCVGVEFYNSAEPTRRETPEGCWTYVPRLSPTVSITFELPTAVLHLLIFLVLHPETEATDMDDPAPSGSPSTTVVRGKGLKVKFLQMTLQLILTLVCR